MGNFPPTPPVYPAVRADCRGAGMVEARSRPQTWGGNPRCHAPIGPIRLAKMTFPSPSA